MQRLTEPEWAVLNVLWSGENFALGQITDALKPALDWNPKTVYTYLLRMEGKGFVTIRRGQARPYSAAVSREDCARQERNALLGKVYGGAAGDLVAAFLKDSKISASERDRLRKLLDEMEV
ncbi:MAG: BlaI/MecI/CopY family transcriptional regulator [Bacillota bacterium]|nr:BlaI/MecI/CopY family transcriptional regulator [Bacillota bacterium]